MAGLTDRLYVRLGALRAACGVVCTVLCCTALCGSFSIVLCGMCAVLWCVVCAVLWCVLCCVCAVLWCVLCCGVCCAVVCAVFVAGLGSAAAMEVMTTVRKLANRVGVVCTIHQAGVRCPCPACRVHLCTVYGSLSLCVCAAKAGRVLAACQLFGSSLLLESEPCGCALPLRLLFRTTYSW